MLRPLPSPSQSPHVIPQLRSRAQSPERTSQKQAGNSANHCSCPGPNPKRCKATGAADLRDMCVPSSGQTVPICHLGNLFWCRISSDGGHKEPIVMLIRSKCCQTKYENRLEAGGWARGTAMPHAPDNSSGAGATLTCAKQNPFALLHPVLGPRVLLNLKVSIQPRETNPDTTPSFQYSINTGKH